MHLNIYFNTQCILRCMGKLCLFPRVTETSAQPVLLNKAPQKSKGRIQNHHEEKKKEQVAGRVSAQQQGDHPSEMLCGSPGRAGAMPHTSTSWTKLPGEQRRHCSFQQKDSYSQLCFTSATFFECSALGSSPMGDWKSLGPWGCPSSVQCQDNIRRENI